eukprot:96532_1
MEAQDFCNYYGYGFMEISALTQYNLKAAFDELVRSALNKDKKLNKNNYSCCNCHYNCSCFKNIISCKNNTNDNIEIKEEGDTMTIKIAMIGAYNIGKGSLAEKYTNDYNIGKLENKYFKEVITNEQPFKPPEPKLGADNTEKFNNECMGFISVVDVVIDVININELEVFGIGNYDAYVFVCDATDIQSLNKVFDVVDLVRNDDDYMYNKPMIIAGNKYDLIRNEQDKYSIKYDMNINAIKYGLNVIETTSFEDFIECRNVYKLFNSLIASIRGYNDINSLQKVANIYQHSGAVRCMCLSIDNKYLFTGSDDGTVRCWDIMTGCQLNIFCAHNNQIFNVQEILMDNKNGIKYLVSCSADGKCCVWITDIYNAKYSIYPSVKEIKNNKYMIPKFMNMPAFIFRHDKQIRDFEMDKNRKLLFTVSDDETLRIWSLINGNCLYIDISKKCILNNIVFINELNKIFVGGSNGIIYSWNLNINIDHNKKHSIKNISRIELKGHKLNKSVNELRVSYQNETNIYLLSGDDCGCIHCWDLSDPNYTQNIEFISHKDAINYMCLGGINNNLLCTASRDEYTRCYTIPNGQILFSIHDNEGSVRGISANNRYIITGGKDEMIRCYDMQNNYKLIWAYQRHEDYLNRIIIDNINQIVFTADRCGLVISWNINNGKALQCFGNKECTNNTILQPKKDIFSGWISLIIEFFQLCTFTFSIDMIDWGESNATYNPFDLTSTLFQFQFDTSALNLNINLSSYNFNYDISFIWIGVILFLWIFIFSFCIQYKLKWGVSKFSAKCRSITATLIWIATTIAFIPIFRILLRSFTCNPIDLQNFLIVPKACYMNSNLHLIYITITAITLLIFLILSYRFARLEGDISCCDVYSWKKWTGDDPDTRRVHSGSIRTADLAFIDHSIKIIMVLVSVYLIAEPESSTNKKILIYSYIFTIILFIGSFILCMTLLIKPPFYFRIQNITSCAFNFGVLWTDFFTFFVISNSINDIQKMILHLGLLPIVMGFGALCMSIRIRKSKYDDIRGEFINQIKDNNNTYALNTHMNIEMQNLKKKNEIFNPNPFISA